MKDRYQTINRRTFCGQLGMLGAAAALAPRLAFADEPAKRPNIIVIFTDDQDRDEIGCYSGRKATPHMDSLARDGIKFSRFYVNSAVCTPSRFCLLTGRYASRASNLTKQFPHGGPVNIGWNPHSNGQPGTLARQLKAAGYTTGMVGKWHQGGGEGMKGLSQNADPRKPSVKKQLEENNRKLVEAVKSNGFDYAASLYRGNVKGKLGAGKNYLPKELQVHNMEWITQGALDFIDQGHDKPFFLYIAPTLPHSPAASRSLKTDPRNTPLGYLDKAPDCQPSRESVLQRAKKKNALPDLVWLDDGVGAVLKKLKEKGLEENTLVWLISDHGNKPKFTCYDGGARVPALARWPGVIKPGSVCNELAASVDVAPTLLSLAGGRQAADMPMDGVDISAVFKGKPYSRDSLYLEITTERAVITNDGWKYIAVRYPPEIQKQVDAGKKFNHWCIPWEKQHHTYKANEIIPAYFEQDQLYNLSRDGREQKNLAKDPQHAKRLGAMKAKLRAYSAKLPHSYGEFTTTKGE